MGKCLGESAQPLERAGFNFDLTLPDRTASSNKALRTHNDLVIPIKKRSRRSYRLGSLDKLRGERFTAGKIGRKQ